MSIFKALLGILKVVLPFLRSAAEKAFKKLPEEEQEKLIQVSMLVEIIKKSKGKSLSETLTAIYDYTGLSSAQVESYILDYWISKGIQAISVEDGLRLIWNDAENSTETGLKSLWSSISSIVSSIVSNVDWEALLMGLGEYVYRTHVKGRVNL